MIMYLASGIFDDLEDFRDVAFHAMHKQVLFVASQTSIVCINIETQQRLWHMSLARESTPACLQHHHPRTTCPSRMSHAAVYPIDAEDTITKVLPTHSSCPFILPGVEHVKAGSKFNVIFVLDSPQKIDGSIFAKAVAQLTFSARDADMQVKLVSWANKAIVQVPR